MSDFSSMLVVAFVFCSLALIAIGFLLVLKRNLGGMALIILGSCVFLLGDEMFSDEPSYSYEIENIAITSLGNDSQTEGFFNGFLFAQSGMIGNTKYYQVYMTDGEKKRLVEFEATQTDVVEYEEGENSPHLEVTWKVSENKIDNFVHNIFVNRDSRFDGYSGFAGKKNHRVEKVVIYAPVGSIDESFSVDWSK